MLRQESGFDQDLLSVVEVGSIAHVLRLTRLHIVLQSAEVVLTMLGLRVGLESLVERRTLALVVLAVDR